MVCPMLSFPRFTSSCHPYGIVDSSIVDPPSILEKQFGPEEKPLTYLKFRTIKFFVGTDL